MDVRELTLHATAANRDLDVVVYGRSGRQVLAFPEGDSSCMSWENNGLVDALSGLVDEGLVQLVCFDSLDDEAWHARGAVGSYRLENVQAFLSFVERDLPAVLASLSGETAPTPPIAAGVGIGALNATLAVLRRPQDFSGLVALSGTYDVSRLLGQELDEDWRLLSPLDIVAGLTPRKKATRLLRELPLAFVCGQEPSETGLDTQRELEELLTSKGVAATFEYWGYDVSHDWYWWREELFQLLPCLLEKDGLATRALVARASRARRAAWPLYRPWPVGAVGLASTRVRPSLR
ncbi:alpha/beta hydrolase-fold protein [Olsenella massiliensis]|uniref:alpha/beta hydrolase-fold protein n=1 Tax=Olsenella massiliensis TaxID=1622075 RepID=UPI00071D0F02|nr:alpha/beta hydrolase-fold protein [Olsenella massiliensis]